MLRTILAAYGLHENQCEIIPFGTGLINNTWKITSGAREYILQRINQNVFNIPDDVADNLRSIGRYLNIHFPDYAFVLPIATQSNNDMVYEMGGYYRLMPFIKNSKTYVVASSPQIAREAAQQFGRFTKTLAGFDAGSLKFTIPHFHDLILRYKLFEDSLKNGNPERIRQCGPEIAFIRNNKAIVTEYEKIVADPNFKKRVTHHDTKISNVLFNEHNKGICVIDLDTTMSGYFISDVGDMMRTYLCPYSEEENEFSRLSVREEYFSAIAEGYLEEMSDELTSSEVDHFVYSGEFMIYMQAVRFLADHFNNDIYYSIKYEGHNLIRAKNQIELLRCYQEKSPIFKKQVQALVEKNKSSICKQ